MWVKLVDIYPIRFIENIFMHSFLTYQSMRGSIDVFEPGYVYIATSLIPPKTVAHLQIDRGFREMSKVATPLQQKSEEMVVINTRI
jgi:hypothetical protein